jgi:hypothetical protein
MNKTQIAVRRRELEEHARGDSGAAMVYELCNAVFNWRIWN